MLKKTIVFCAVTLCLLCNSACTTASKKAKGSLMAAPAVMSEKADHSWWNCRFQMTWQDGDEPDLSADLLLAHRVVQPLLQRHINQLQYWRFHRRAARDSAGHKFSFMFYASAGTATAISTDLQQDVVLQQAQDAMLVKNVICDDPDKPVRPGVADTSDPAWPVIIQQNWPVYIMGVSAMWLGLIDDTVSESAISTDNIRASLEDYREADEAIAALWHNEAQHAFLHHLNAIFGYQPMMLHKEIRF